MLFWASLQNIFPSFIVQQHSFTSLPVNVHVMVSMLWLGLQSRLWR